MAALLSESMGSKTVVWSRWVGGLIKARTDKCAKAGQACVHT